MSDLKKFKRDFREALINAHDWNTLAIVLEYHCERRLDRITVKSEGFNKNVDDVLEDAVQTGWLEMLAKGVLAAVVLNSVTRGFGSLPPIRSAKWIALNFTIGMFYR